MKTDSDYLKIKQILDSAKIEYEENDCSARASAEGEIGFKAIQIFTSEDAEYRHLCSLWEFRESGELLRVGHFKF